MNRILPETLLLPAPGGRAHAPSGTTAVVVGGGIAGVAAATVLAERGVSVTLIEREAWLGGRAGAFPERLDTGESVEMERGFHAYFRQYYNLRALLRRIDPELSMLEALDDYPILGPEGMVQSFRGLPRRTPLQLLALVSKTPYLGARDLGQVNAREAMRMLTFDPDRTYRELDELSAGDYLDSLAFPERARRMLFDVFAHSFFNPEREMSAAELVMMFHFYFTGNPEGLVFDVLRRPASSAIWQPFARWLQARGVRLQLGSAVDRIERRSGGGYRVEHAGGASEGDLLALCLDVGGLRQVVARSPDLKPLSHSIDGLEIGHPFAVYRLWLDRPVAAERPAFVGTTGVGLLDNISVYDRFQDESAGWAQRHRGSVVELHAYAVPPHIDLEMLRRNLIAGLHHFYPETREAQIVEQRFLWRRDCPAFAIGGAKRRPGVATAWPDLALAGDAIAVPLPCALMERSAASGMLAANTLLAPLGVAPEPIRSVPRRGLFARPGPAVSLGSNGGAARLRVFGRARLPRPALDPRPDWEQAEPAWIREALARSQRLPSGGWYAVDATRALGETPRAYWVAGKALVLWRENGTTFAAPEACPHLGASLAGARVCAGALVCPWHGLRLGPDGHRGWRHVRVHDDGVLTWVQLPGPGEAPSAAPFGPVRPREAIDSVIRLEVACEPRDVIQNRLDPWHGVHFHPHSFGRLHVIDQREDEVTVRVAYRVLGPLAIEVDARFHCPDPRTIVMTIVRGEGEGSVVETHATPTRPGHTAVIEATLASSERPGFVAARRATPLLRPLMQFAARRLWEEDARYAERLYQLRHRELRA